MYRHKCHHFMVYYYAGIAVRMEDADYTVEEGQTARVCVVIEGDSNIVISVEVNTDEITAEGQEVTECM